VKLFDRFRRKQYTPAAPDIKELGEPFSSLLSSMYAGEPQLGVDGTRHEIDSTTRISAAQGMWLYHLCCQLKPRATLEIGLAYGFSAVYFLAANSRQESAFHTAVDPFQLQSWHGVGAQRASVVGCSERFQFISKPSDLALAQFIRDQEFFDVIFIDGNHRFDDVLVDFSLSAHVCKPQGHVVLDDMWMPSIRKVAAFIRKNRTDFDEVPTPVGNIAVFRRIGTDDRKWDHFIDFV
jgi:predicted O-methyltransferase YrrM